MKRVAAAVALLLWVGSSVPALGVGQPPVRLEPSAAAASRAEAAPAGARAGTANASPKQRGHGRLTARQLGLVINESDPYSVQVGEFYAQARGLRPHPVLRVVLPVEQALSAGEFELLAAQIQRHFGADIQGLALAWSQPFAVGCQSITGALALGIDTGLCERSCEPTPASPYFDSAARQPWSQLRMRPSMLLAAADVPAARALIERGIAADGSLGWRGAPPVQAHFVVTGDAARSVRARLYPPAGLLRDRGVNLTVHQQGTSGDVGRVLLYLTGLSHVPGLEHLDFVPGALADHLTSYGGRLQGGSGQMSALAWIDAGATASYGTVSEPCNHVQKFPHPQVLLQHYLSGSTALEAYWKSVAWPSQGVFIGEPLAAPFARP